MQVPLQCEMRFVEILAGHMSVCGFICRCGKDARRWVCDSRMKCRGKTLALPCPDLVQITAAEGFGIILIKN